MPSSTRRPSATTPTTSARSAVESRWAMTMTVRPSIRRAMACSTTTSVPGSRLEVASSSTSTAGSARAARASETSCFSPADRREPRSRTSVARPSGRRANRSRTPMASRAASTSSSVAPARARRTFSMIVPLNRKPSWGTTTTRSRSERNGGVAQVDAAVPHGTLGRVVEAGDELGQGGLPGPGGADEREAGTDGDVQVDVAQDVGTPRRRRSHAVDVDVPPLGQVDRRPTARARRRACRAGRTACGGRHRPTARC